MKQLKEFYNAATPQDAVWLVDECRPRARIETDLIRAIKKAKGECDQGPAVIVQREGITTQRKEE